MFQLYGRNCRTVGIIYLIGSVGHQPFLPLGLDTRDLRSHGLQDLYTQSVIWATLGGIAVMVLA